MMFKTKRVRDDEEKRSDIKYMERRGGKRLKENEKEHHKNGETGLRKGMCEAHQSHKKE